MRSRNIKPGFFLNELLGTEDPIISLLFIGLWCLADREGRLEDRPKRIKAALFPYRENIDINGYLTVLSRLDFVKRYELNGERYVQIVNFTKHQKPHHTERKSEIPPYVVDNSKVTTNNGEITVKQPLNNGVKTVNIALIPDSLIPDSLIPEIKEQVQIDEKAYRQKVIERFLNFWKAYPKKFKQGITEQVWCDIFFSPNGEDKDHLYESIINAVENQKATWSDPKYIPTPDNWLKDRRWLDELPKPETYEERQKRELEETKRRLGYES